MSSPAVRPRLAVRVALLCHELVGRADRSLPRGIAHLCLQFLIWIGFCFAYNVTRGVADRNVATAFDNGRQIASAEERLGLLFEPSLQGVLEWSTLLTAVTSYTYWLSHATVAVALLWVYLRRHRQFPLFRNWLILANVAGLVCYALIPTAPPRMFPERGFTDTLAESASVNHDTLSPFANAYAAMPSLHAMDAFIVGLVMFTVVFHPVARVLWLMWPAWVAFAVMATANHYWLDVAAGILIAIFAAFALRPRRVPLPLPTLRRAAPADRAP